MVVCKINLFLFSSKRQSPCNRIFCFLLLVQASKLIITDFTLFIRSTQSLEKCWQCRRNEKYIQFPNCKNIEDLDSLENYDEIYAYLDDGGLIGDELEILNLLSQKCGICCFELDE